MSDVSSPDLYFRASVTSIAARDAFQPRRWGMVITVVEAAVQTNYQLVYGVDDTDINNNANWRQVDDATIYGTNTKYFTKELEQHSAATGLQSEVLTEDEIEDGDSVLIEVPWAAKRDDNNSGAGGLFIACWTKSGGILNKVFDNNTLNASDTGQAFTISTLDSSGSIRISASTSIYNFSISWVARITQRKA